MQMYVWTMMKHDQMYERAKIARGLAGRVRAKIESSTNASRPEDGQAAEGGTDGQVFTEEGQEGEGERTTCGGEGGRECAHATER